MTAQLDRTDEAVDNGLRGTGGINRVGALLALVAILCALAGARLVDADGVDGYGLISAMPLLYWIGFAIGALATVLLMWPASTNEDSVQSTAAPAMWLVLLHAAPQLAHAHVRFPGTWAQVGLLRFVGEGGTEGVLVDPRLAWPGFHGTFMASMADLDDRILETVLRLWPSLVTGAVAVLVAALARRSYPTVPNVAPLSALAYVFLAWTGHDYFSPQSMALIWVLAILVLMEGGPLQTSSAWSAAVPLLPRFSASGGDRPASRSVPAFVALIVLSFGTIVSQPTASVFVCVSLVLLGLHGRSLAWRLFLFVGLAAVVWFLVSAEPWWSGATEPMTSPFSGLSERGSAPSPSTEYSLVLSSRTGFALFAVAVVALSGVAMAGDRRRHLRPAIPLVPLIVAFALTALVVGRDQSIADVLVFTIPLASILMGRSLVALSDATLPLAAAILAAILGVVFLTARFGGERFEMVTKPDRAALVAASESASGDTLFVADNHFVPWRDRDIGANTFAVQPIELSDAWVDEIERMAVQSGEERIVVVLTDSQLGWRVHGQGESDPSFDEVAEWLLERPGSEVLFHEKNAWAIEL